MLSVSVYVTCATLFVLCVIRTCAGSHLSNARVTGYTRGYCHRPAGDTNEGDNDPLN